MITNPYTHYPYFHHDGYETILVPMEGDKKIRMILSDRYGPEEEMVLFADPLKLAPIMASIGGYNAKTRPPFLQQKHANACEGIAAAIADAKIVNPLPMASVELCFGTEIRFNDGIIRTTELLYQKAAFVPLQVPRNHSDLLQGMIGMDEMPMRSESSYIVRCNIGKVWLSDEAGCDINRHFLST